MEAPFVFGKIATDKNFTDREEETRHLVGNFLSLINTTIISPRRWGKSSLVNKASEEAIKKDKNIRVCHLDLFNVRDEEQFYQMLSQELIMATSSKWEEAVNDVKKFFVRLVPKIILGDDPNASLTLSFDWNELKNNPDEVLDLAENIAKTKKIKLVVCIDEFQNISNFENPTYFQKKLRAHWQHHQHVAYCLYGSKRHMMMDIFANSQMPFYKFGDLMFLDKISTADFKKFIKERFRATGRSIDDDACEKIISLADNHPYYVQQLSQLSWLRAADGHCTIETVLRSHETLVSQLSLLFVNLTESLTNQQLAFLNALVHGETALSSSEVMNKYGISSPVSVARCKKSLAEKDIIDVNAGRISFQDPIYAYWLLNNYFTDLNVL